MLSLRVDFLFRSYSPRIQTQVYILVGNPQFEIRKTWISVQTPLLNIPVILGNLHSSVSESLNLLVCKMETVIMLPTRASLVAQMIKNLPAVQCGRPGFDSWVGKIPWRREWQPTPVFVPGEFHGQRSLVGNSPWGCRVRHHWATNIHTHIVLPFRVVMLPLVRQCMWEACMRAQCIEGAQKQR